jgi:hypothetical protein
VDAAEGAALIPEPGNWDVFGSDGVVGMLSFALLWGESLLAMIASFIPFATTVFTAFPKQNTKTNRPINLLFIFIRASKYYID